MPTCRSCGKSWTWSISLKRILSFRQTMICPHCQKSQYQAHSSRFKTSGVILIPTLLLPVYIMFELSITTALFIELAIMIAALFVLPFFLELSNQDEPMW
ncbi:TIGR04104 family putative zinc finger protein [Pradoshia sp.]